MPLFEAIGQSTFRVGDKPRAANLVKLSGNFLYATVIESLGEAMALVGKAGINRRQYLDFLTSTLFPAPVYKTYGELIVEGQYQPARVAAPLGFKDIRFTIAAAEALRVPMPLASLLHDLFVQLLARPRPALGLRLDVRRLTLASAGDLWYGGSGATLGAGNTFGYAGRRSNGSRDLGTSVETSADFAVTSHVSVNAFLAHIRGGPVVTGTFDGDRLWYGYVESIVTLGER
jgi:hypothetical protein